MSKSIAEMLTEIDEDIDANISEERLVCLCKKVSFATIKNAVLNGAETIDSIRKTTTANTGCSSYCTEEIIKIIKQFNVKL